MRKMILFFSLGAMVGMAGSLMAKSLCSCQNEIQDLIKTSCQKIKHHMQSSKECLECSTKDAIEEMADSLDNIELEALPSKVKKTINKVRNRLDDLR